MAAEGSPSKRARVEEEEASGAGSAGGAALAAAAAGGAPGDRLMLYSYWRSSCSWRVRIVLELLELPYEYRAVHLVRGGGEQLKAEYAAVNPMRAVPALEVDGVVLTESMAIAGYLLETRGAARGVSLLPEDALGRARVRAMVDVVVADTQPVQNLRVLAKVASLFPDATPAESQERKTAFARHWIQLGFEALEVMLRQHAGKFCYRDALSLADVVLVPQVYNAGRFGVDMAPFPTITRVHDALKDLPAFRRAHPSAQPDAEA